MKRRSFIALVAGAVALPAVGRAQQPAIRVIGFLSVRESDEARALTAAVHQGLKEAGFVEGQNIAIEYRFAGNQHDRLLAMAADLAHRQVSVIVATTTPAALAAKAATTSIPIVFETGGDPVRLGLVASLARPGGNVTGVTQLNTGLAPKRLQLLHELLPAAKRMARLVNPASSISVQKQTRDLLSAARNLGLELHVLNASTERDFDAVFTSMIQLSAGGLLIDSDSFFTARQEQLAALAIRHAVPAVYETREFAAAGGLMSYGGSITEAYRLAGVYAGRILNGDLPGELPVQQVTKVDLVLNLKTAKALGLSIPPTLLARTDEVIE